jgi:cell division septation protein DedD
MQKAEGWPDAVSFDPTSGVASPAFEESLRSWAATPVVLLAVGPLAQRGGWAADAAILLADTLAASGERVVLADLSLDRPELHELVGTENIEGLTDVFLFGASLEHVTLKLPAHAFELVPAAPFTPDAEEILTHRRWSMVFEEFAASKTRLILYLPITIDGTGALSDRVGHTVVLADRWEAESVRAALSSDADIMGFFAPPQSAERDEEMVAPPAPAPVSEPLVGGGRIADRDFEKIRIPKDGAREALIADLRSRQRRALMDPAPPAQPLPEEVDVVRAKPVVTPRIGFPTVQPGISEPTFASTVRTAKPRPRRVLPALVVVLLVSSAAATWHYWGRTFLENRRAGAVANGGNDETVNGGRGNSPGSPALRVTEPPLPAGRVLPYSVAMAGYQLLDQAQERVEQLRRDAPTMQFYIAPTVVQGQLFYRVLAGPLPDSSTAAAVRDTLMARRIKVFSSSSDLLETPYAYLIGSFERRVDAVAKAAEAANKGIPTYIVPVGLPGGNTQYRLYAGAYTGPGDADFLRSILEAASLPDTLVERTGSIRS